MKMSTKGRYGLRVMMELANNHGKGPTTIDLIAKHQGISGKYIHFLMTGLKSAGLVRTIRGPNGGFELAKDPSTISALDVVSVLEGWKAPVECVENAEILPAVVPMRGPGIMAGCRHSGRRRAFLANAGGPVLETARPADGSAGLLHLGPGPPLDPIYLDHNATTPPDPEVIEEMSACLGGGLGNPSSIHAFGQEARRISRRRGCGRRG